MNFQVVRNLRSWKCHFIVQWTCLKEIRGIPFFLLILNVDEGIQFCKDCNEKIYLERGCFLYWCIGIILPISPPLLDRSSAESEQIIDVLS